MLLPLNILQIRYLRLELPVWVAAAFVPAPYGQWRTILDQPLTVCDAEFSSDFANFSIECSSYAPSDLPGGG